MQRDSALNRNEANGKPLSTEPSSSSSRVAGLVGVFTGIGALISLAVFLPLPARFQKAGISPAQALQDSYYVVAAVALVLSVWSFFGLRQIRDDEGKGIIMAIRSFRSDKTLSDAEAKITPFWMRFSTSFIMGFKNRKIGLGYTGGLVARASSVGISLFIPLAINAQFKSAGLCNVEVLDAPAGLPDIKRRCPRAYTLSAELTGVSQLIALLAAPGFGYLSARLPRNIPLIFGACAGIAGYITFGISVQHKREGVNGTVGDFVAMALIGLSQIAAIVCSLGILSDGILQQSQQRRSPEVFTDDGQSDALADDAEGEGMDEESRLMGGNDSSKEDASALKGSIAGMYSLYGGAGILILTKMGGSLFDKVSFGSPFYIMATFNGVLLAACILTALKPYGLLLSSK
ncbi:putative mfs [Phaeomoniella chlamydospora]|uniref:Putative mfs n=1 Tax=Phaeomoniella chlamydospora TaxID=158046 RepID=A0A0G2E7I1_PHACM|nr:putative mfs [Phaeomoniella chlamydospora]